MTMFPQDARDQMDPMKDDGFTIDAISPIAAALPEAGLNMRDLISETGTSPMAISTNGNMMPASVLRIPVAIQVVIGSARVPLSQVTQLGPGATITLDQKLGSPAVILVNGKEVARGELFVLDAVGGQLGITITEVTGSNGGAAA